MTDKSSKRKNKDLRHAAYRRARSNIRGVIKPFWVKPLFDTGQARIMFTGGDLDGTHTTNEFPAADLFRLVNHHCPPGGDDRATEGRLQGMHCALIEIGRAVHGPEYTPSDSEPVARQITRLAEAIERKTLQKLHDLTYGPDGTGEQQDRLPDDITVEQHAQAVNGLYAQERQLGEQSGAAQVLTRIGIDWPSEWNGQEVTVERVVSAIRSYYTTQPQGQAIREARAAERANILGHLGININLTAAPGTQGAVAQIRNWADAQAETAERNTLGAVLRQLHDELFRDSRWTAIPAPITVPAADPAGYASWLRDHLAQDAQQRREDLVFELGASSEQAAEITDDEELRAFLVAGRQDAVVSTAHRIIRQSLGHEAARAVLEADTTANTPDAVISAAVEAVTAALQDRTPAPPAVRRYAELRRRYSAEHDAHEHGTGHFTAAVFALLLNDDQRLTDVQTWADGSESFTCRAPAHLWPFANSPAGRCDAARRAREKPGDWRLIEAAALLMCAVDHGNEETADA